MRTLALLSVLIILFLPTAMFAQPPAQTPPPPCVPAGNVQFVCGHNGAGRPCSRARLRVGGCFFLRRNGWHSHRQRENQGHNAGVSERTAKEQQDTKTYAACPGPPDAAQKAMFTTHGLALREGKNSLHTLYVVNHSKRESIEVFELNAKVSPPVLTWIGCAVAPDPIGLNEVLPLPDGGFIGTDFLARGDASFRESKDEAGEVNGALWEWHSGKGWTKIPGSEASGANGLEIIEGRQMALRCGMGKPEILSHVVRTGAGET